MVERGMIEEAVASGERQKVLEALQMKLAESLDNTKSGVGIAALANQLIKTTEELHNLQTEQAKPAEEVKNVLQIVRSKHKRDA